MIVSNRKDTQTIIAWPNGVAIDFEAQYVIATSFGYIRYRSFELRCTISEHVFCPFRRVYWTDARLDSISSADWDGQDRKVILSGAMVVPHPYGIGIYKHRCTRFESGSSHHCIVEIQ